MLNYKIGSEISFYFDIGSSKVSNKTLKTFKLSTFYCGYQFD